MNKSESIAAISQAIAKAQHDVENASKNAKNPHFKVKYGDLAELLNTVRPVLVFTVWQSYKCHRLMVVLQA